MSLKSIIQILIIFIITIIVFSIYSKYFSVSEKDIITKEVVKEVVKEVEENNQLQENDKQINEKKINEDKIAIIENIETINEISKIDEKSNKVNKKNNDEVLKVENPKNDIDVKKNKQKNLVKNIEYITTGKNGNEYRLKAKSGKTNSDDNNVLDLIEVNGKITSKIRPTIFISSDYAQYNSVNQNSKFYKNVIINYEDKEIICDNFDINMETNFAVAYNNVKVTDPQSTMYAGEIILDLKTKDIDIKPESEISKVNIITK
tara:strand:- start:1534 stop:2316 length:783 start_codon:yes stop_codon:yes gene_type:complete